MVLKTDQILMNKNYSKFDKYHHIEVKAENNIPVSQTNKTLELPKKSDLSNPLVFDNPLLCDLNAAQAVFNERTKNSPPISNNSVSDNHLKDISTAESNNILNMKTKKTNENESTPQNYCMFCNKKFPNKHELLEHCHTQEHKSFILSDEGRDWKFRPPPRALLSYEYSLCKSMVQNHGLSCKLKDQCIQAHSKEELAEWKERFEYRSMKLEKAKERELHGTSFADRILEKLNQSQNMDSVISEKIPHLKSSLNSNSTFSISQKPTKHTWILSVQCPFLMRVATLLYDSHRSHFSITSINVTGKRKSINKSHKLNGVQEWHNSKKGLRLDENEIILYEIEILFNTNVYGTFRQALVIDFGVEPAFLQKFCVDILPLDKIKDIEVTRTTIVTQSQRWCNDNSNIVLFFHQVVPKELFNSTLLRMYSPPTNENLSLSQSSLQKHPSKNNYNSRLHDLLNYEEMAQFNLLSQFNIKSFLQICTSYLISPSLSGANYAIDGELYAKLYLSSEISEDSPGGRLILNNCNTVLLNLSNKRIPQGGRRTVYEALIEAKTKKEIYFRISKQTVTELKLEPDTEISFNIQFELNRLPFCEIHYAIDHISDVDFLFPRITIEPVIPWSPSLQWNGSKDFRKMNVKQKEALVAATADPKLQLPPILLIGPFGTGKTFTLAQIVFHVVQQPKTNVLICTHSNSAADIYIKEYFHPLYESGDLETKPLRLYYKNRRLATVHNTVQQYCYFSSINGVRTFDFPSKSELMSHRIIVTTINTSINMASLHLPKGFFTHILIDEAAQVMECSTLIPLTFMNSSTRVILAGDYMQMSTEVFSPVCKERNLHMSLLERLYDHYPSDFPCKIMLIENYRSHAAIIKFTSRFFYDGLLKSKGKVSAHPKYHPLTFYTALGQDVQDVSSTAYYNDAEVLEVCERVEDICHNWPSSWGPLNQEHIGVLSPYMDQVMRIRSELKKKKLYKVNVERVLNVQGKEFRVVVLSTVRTRHTCGPDHDHLDYGFLSNVKLLTTAITRAQSLVMVIGDPVSLCSLGKCRKIWEEFISQCSISDSLHGITWTNFRSQLDGIELKKIYGLNPLAQEFIPKFLFVPLPTPLSLYPTQHPLSMPLLPYPQTPFSHLYPGSPLMPYQTASVPGCAPKLGYPPQSLYSVGYNPGFGINPLMYNSNPLYFYNNGLVPYPMLSNPIPNTILPQTLPLTNPLIPAWGQSPLKSIIPDLSNSYNGVPIIRQDKLFAFPPPKLLPLPVSPRVVNGTSSSSDKSLSPIALNTTSQNHLANSKVSSEVIVRVKESSSEKSVRFLKNVHFPTGVSPPCVEEVENQTEVSTIENRDVIEADDSSNFDAFNGEKFAEEISKLLSDQSPIKRKPPGFPDLAKPFPDSSGSDTDVIFQRNARTSTEPISIKPLLPSVDKSVSKLTQPDRPRENSYFGSSNLSGSQRNHYNGLSNISPVPSSRSIESNLLLNKSQERDSLFTEQSTWDQGIKPIRNKFSIASFLQSGSDSSKSLPLYLRKGNANLSTREEMSSRNTIPSGLIPSSGWGQETIENKYATTTFEGKDNGLRGIRCSNTENSLLRNGLQNFGGVRSAFPRHDQADLKTYAGALRNSLGGSEQH